MRRKTPTVEKTTPVAIAPLLTVEDVANILQLSRVKVYEHIKRNGLPSVKISGARRFQPAQLQSWIDQQQQQ